MPNTNRPNRPRHITTGDILDDLGFSPQETRELRIKSDLWRDLLAHIEHRAFDQAQLKTVLRIHQPDVSNLLRGKISKFSIGKLIQFAVRLNLDVRVQLKEPTTVRPKRSREREGGVLRALRRSPLVGAELNLKRRSKAPGRSILN